MFLCNTDLKAEVSKLTDGWVGALILTMFRGWEWIEVLPTLIPAAVSAATFLACAFPEQCISKSTLELHCNEQGLHQKGGISGSLKIKIILNVSDET